MADGGTAVTEGECHRLQRRWVYWENEVIAGSSEEAYLRSLHKVHTLDSVEAFWRFWHNYPTPMYVLLARVNSVGCACMSGVRTDCPRIPCHPLAAVASWPDPSSLARPPPHPAGGSSETARVTSNCSAGKRSMSSTPSTYLRKASTRWRSTPTCDEAATCAIGQQVSAAMVPPPVHRGGASCSPSLLHRTRHRTSRHRRQVVAAVSAPHRRGTSQRSMGGGSWPPTCA